MNKISLYVLAAVIVGGVVWYGLQSPDSDGTDNTANQNEEGTEATGDFKALLAMSYPQECTFESSESAGVAYIANNRMRGDFVVTSEGQSQNGHMIVKDDTAYVWVDGETQGFKMSAIADAETTNEQFDLDQEVDYDCKGWRVDEDKFREPTTVTFTDFSELLQGLQGGAGATGSFGF